MHNYKRYFTLVILTVILMLTYNIVSFATDEVVIKEGHQIPPESPEITAVRKQVDALIDELLPSMIEMSDYLYKNPESAFVEFESSAMITKMLEENGFVVEWDVPKLPEVWPEFAEQKYLGGLSRDVEKSYLPTAFKAKYKGKSEAPVFTILVEYDALRGNPPFHGCQHNMQGPTGAGAAIALAKVMEENNIPGSIWVIGTPAEEVGPPTKLAMAMAGYLENTDFAIRSHGMNDKTETLEGDQFSSMHIIQHQVTFNGATSHAAMAWGSQSHASDAAILYCMAVEFLREQSEPQFRFHHVITNGGIAANIIPDKCEVQSWVRHFLDETEEGNISPGEARKMIEEKAQRMIKIAEGIAMATNTTVDVQRYGLYVPSISAQDYHDIGLNYAVEYGGKNIEYKTSGGSGFDETGAMSLQVPGICVTVGVDDPDISEVPGHSQQNADLTCTDAGHKNLEAVAKTMAATLLRLAMDKELASQVKATQARLFEEYNKE